MVDDIFRLTRSRRRDILYPLGEVDTTRSAHDGFQGRGIVFGGRFQSFFCTAGLWAAP